MKANLKPRGQWYTKGWYDRKLCVEDDRLTTNPVALICWYKGIDGIQYTSASRRELQLI